MLKVFVTTYCMRYKLFGRTLSEVSGSVISAAITYRKDNNNEYTLESYQGARDGSEFETSIREYCTQPVSGKKIVGLADEIFNHYSDYDDIRKLHYENLNEHLKIKLITISISIYKTNGDFLFINKKWIIITNNMVLTVKMMYNINKIGRDLKNSQKVHSA